MNVIENTALNSQRSTDILTEHDNKNICAAYNKEDLVAIIEMKKRPDVMIRTIDELPMIVSAEDVAAVLQISRAKAYQLLHRKDFPTLKIDKRLLVPKAKFFEWINSKLD